MTTHNLASARSGRNAKFWHPNFEHLRAITRRFATGRTDDFALVRRGVPMPAFLKFAGFPLASHQHCFKHRGTTGRALSIYQHQSAGFWMFHCNNPQCGITGDVSEFWFSIVQLAGRAPVGWDKTNAAADLLARIESGEIDPKLTTLADAPLSAGTEGPRPHLPDSPFIAEIKRHYSVLSAMASLPCQLRPRPLPRPIRLRVREVLRALFPQDGLLLVTPRIEWQSQHIRLRDDWLKVRTLPENSFVSSSYLARADLNCSYAAFAKRRWLVIEDDKLSLGRQLAIHATLASLDAPLRCVCYSGGKSLHGWYLVEGLPERQCFELYAAAKGFGISDCATYSIRQPVRLPGGWNASTNRRQLIYFWNL